jgi:hypothetical protein
VNAQTKRELWVITVTTLAAVPFVAGPGFIAATGLLAM